MNPRKLFLNPGTVVLSSCKKWIADAHVLYNFDVIPSIVGMVKDDAEQLRRVLGLRKSCRVILDDGFDVGIVMQRVSKEKQFFASDWRFIAGIKRIETTVFFNQADPSDYCLLPTITVENAAISMVYGSDDLSPMAARDGLMTVMPFLKEGMGHKLVPEG